MTDQDLSPAERYARARERQARLRTGFGAFEAGLGFEADEFQRRAGQALEDGTSVLVAAPTGAGKTVVAEFAVRLALDEGRRLFYTAPIKALSNQKFHELAAVHGAERVGLLTGDTVVNGDAQIVVMTTEVLRNMIYEGSSRLESLGFVVLDEVHYLADRFRGPVWEEVIIMLPDHVRLVSLSATVSNAEEFGAWLAEVRGETEVIVSERRPVPLYHHIMVGDRVYDMFGRDGKPNPALKRFTPRPGGYRGHGPGRDRGRHRDRGRDRSRAQRDRLPRRASRVQVIEELRGRGLLPAITFIFSRNGCDEAVTQCLAAGVLLTDREDRARIQERLDALAGTLEEADLGVLGFATFSQGLLAGVAAHHAGMLPQFKQLVEQLFQEGLLSVVFATETLALGINMPARTVVLEQLTKFNGETHATITPGEFTQLTGRAGRRGIDVEGHALVVWNPQLDPAEAAGLAVKRSYRLVSSFRPTYNMAANLATRLSDEEAETVLETSFAQFQADRGVVGLAKRVRKNEEALESYAGNMECERGDFAEYHRLRRQLSAAERQGRGGGDREARERRRQDLLLALRAHPCHGCPDRERHARWADRWWKLRKDTDSLIRQIEGRTSSIAKVYRRVCAVLEALEFLPDNLSQIIRIYGERDLLTALSVREGVWDGLGPAEAAGLAAALVYQPRRDDAALPERYPTERLTEALERVFRLWSQVEDLEEQHRLPRTPRPEPGLVWPVYRWAQGRSLEGVLRRGDMAAGDFVRWAKQTVDLLDQIAQVAEPGTRGVLEAAIDAVRRGVVI
ncbi:DEAD/DEAH box helicase [Sediminivirga luteola]|uniref:ATP-dependent RNA helicase HelY n=1 Tax=Sediminivirga luteola TaxID=1774748 RepID=A0A8J2XM24_9MICO|nr:DEAD/DEAH box helicase [Sediminivirga luteola]MCI2264053.1 DEAD/DEAH box helicase [Sediminivirga luteola]GGA22730.1 hypothetical protein GCM10011333_27150 [Sediminivirga luteola]